MKRLRINRPSPAELSSICGSAGSLGIDSQNRLGGSLGIGSQNRLGGSLGIDSQSRYGSGLPPEPVPRDRRLEFSRTRFSSSQSQQSFSQNFSQSQTSDYPPLPLICTGRSSTDNNSLEQRLATLESRRLSVDNNLENRLVSLENRRSENNAPIEQRLASLENRRSENNAAVEQRLASLENRRSTSEKNVEQRLAALETLISGVSHDLANVGKDLASQIKELPHSFSEHLAPLQRQLSSQQEALKGLPKVLAEMTDLNRKVTRALKTPPAAPRRPEIMQVESDDETVSKGSSEESHTVSFEDVFGTQCTGKEMRKMREKLQKARRMITYKRRRSK